MCLRQMVCGWACTAKRASFSWDVTQLVAWPMAEEWRVA